MADPFAAQQVGGAHRVPEPDQAAAAMGFPATDAAADQAAMAIDHDHSLPLGWLQQALDQPLQHAPQGRLVPAGVEQATHPQLEAWRLHGKHPAVALGDPVAAQTEGQPITPTLPAGVGHLHQPLQAHTAHQRLGSRADRRRFSEQSALLARGINHPVAVNLKATAIAPAQDGMNPIRILVAGQGPVAKQHLGSPALGLPHQPLAQGPEIKHHPLGTGAPPAPAVFTGAQKLPATPAMAHHPCRQSKTVEDIEGEGRAAEGGAAQIGEALHEQHIHPMGG